MSYQRTAEEVWTGRSSAGQGLRALYLHEIIEVVNLEDLKTDLKQSIVFLGFMSDEGVRRNLGRTGAKNGPNAIRSALGKFAVHFDIDRNRLVDVGNIFLEGTELESAQEELGEAVCSILNTSAFPIILGGGHETAFGHYLGLRSYIGTKKLGIINIDAHFDLRSYEKGPHSGSPFRQVLDDCIRNQYDFHYLPLGINPAGNQGILFDVLSDAGQQCVLERDVQFDGLERVASTIQEFIAKVDSVYLSIDLDVLSAAYAPGVSAPAAFGLDPHQVRRLIGEVFKSEKVISMDVVELNPEYDDSRTAKLAASFIYEIIHQFIFK